MTNRDPLHTPRITRERALRNLATATEALRKAVNDVLESGGAEADVARRAGVDRMTIRAWRRGNANQARPEPREGYYTCMECGAYAHTRADHEESCSVRNPHPAALMPEPKGFKCPVCHHGTSVHRAGGCDADRCDCFAPHGRLMPGDPDPIPNREATR